MLLSHLAECARLSLKYPKNVSVDSNITSISSDTRTMKSGTLFFAVKGKRNDGRLYAEYAVKNGALAIVVDRENSPLLQNLGVPVFECENVRESLSLAHGAFFEDCIKKLKIIAVTGTNGKTSISCILSAIFSEAKISHAVIGTLGCFVNGERIDVESSDPLSNMTTPDPDVLYPLLARLSDLGVRYVIMEASSHASALGKLAPLDFASAIFSNLTPEHLDFHSDMKDYFNAKLAVLKKARRVFVNADSEYASEIDKYICRQRCTYVSLLDGKYDLYAKNICQNDFGGMDFTLCDGRNEFHFSTKLIGRFNVENVALAISCAVNEQVPYSSCRKALASFSGVNGRMKKLDLPSSRINVYIDYAHTPFALERALESLLSIAHDGEPLTVLFGCGGERDRAKRPLMAKASQLADRVILTSDNSRGEDKTQIIREIISGFDESFTDYTVIENRKEAITHAVLTAKDGEIILLAGKGHEKYEIDKNGRHSFDEEKTVLDAVKLRGRL